MPVPKQTRSEQNRPKEIRLAINLLASGRQYEASTFRGILGID
jgi:hypothetical protein